MVLLSELGLRKWIIKKKGEKYSSLGKIYTKSKHIIVLQFTFSTTESTPAK